MELGFIILRHVNESYIDKYWKLSYESIRKYYPLNNILIIDDNSNYEYIDVDYEKNLINTTVIKSEYPGRGELLPYLYYLQKKHCDTACIIHDSVFINSEFITNHLIEDSKNACIKLWNFKHNWDQPEDELNLISSLDNNSDLIKFHKDKTKWNGCFGGMSIINYDFLNTINTKHDLFKLTNVIKTRYNRMSFERVSALLFQYYTDKFNVEIKNKKKTTLLGDIHDYCPWGIKFRDIYKYKHLAVIKVWTGR